MVNPNASLVAAIVQGQQESGLSLTALAAEAGVDLSLLNKIMRGELTATPEVAEKIAKALDRWAARSTKAANSIRKNREGQ
jgi:ribosome-binding protein aMBF1 (putative translation factor)